jgi:ribokinase
MPSRRIVVIGSVNMDLVCRAPRIPQPGETILGDNLHTVPGGKGANQAVAAARLASDDIEVHLIARVGDDDFGQRLLNGLSQHRVATEHVTITESSASGCAVILVDKAGENAIVVAPGANAKLTPADVDRAARLIHDAAVVVMQCEVPLETLRHAAAVCRQRGVPVFIDPAPVPPRGLPRELFAVDVLTPNRTEAEQLLGLHRVKTRKIADPKQIGMDLIAKGPGTVVLKLGSKGALIVDSHGHIESSKPFKTTVEDTTAAGDAFTAALAVGRTEGMSMAEAVRFANAAGALCCQEFGAQPALPAREEVIKLMGKRR